MAWSAMGEMMNSAPAHPRLRSWTPAALVRRAGARSPAEESQPISETNPGLFYTLLVTGLVLFVVGFLLFAHNQTQALFRDIHGWELSGGVHPRDDAGILFGALVAGSGLATILWALSPLPRASRFLMVLGTVGAFVTLLVAHFSIFVNGVIFSQEQTVHVQASFLFHDTIATLPINAFALAFLTLIIILIGHLAAMRLLTPDLYRTHIHSPTTLEDHRTRFILATLLLLGVGAAFTRQFFVFAVGADATPADGFLSTNLVAIYYLMGFALAIALLTVAWRAFILCWGNLVERTTRRFRRGHHALTRFETWLWGAILLLNLVILIAPPVFRPDAGTDRVFVMDSRGISWFFLLFFPLYLLHRRIGASHLRFLSRIRSENPTPRLDRLAAMTLTILVLWVLGGLLLPLTGLSPLSALLFRVAPLAVALPFFVLRMDVQSAFQLRTRGPGSPLVLIASAALAIVTGIMLWGVGNSVTVQYSQVSGGFLTPEGRLLQPYSTGIRILGALFMTLPALIMLWLVSTRHASTRNTQIGPLIVSGLAIVFAMNLLFTIDPAGQFDAGLGYTDVHIGFWALLMAETFDTVIMMVLWAAATAIGLIAAVLLLRRGVEPGEKNRPGSTSQVPDIHG